jgi:hypothetical protein
VTPPRAVILAVVLSLPVGFVGGFLLHRWITAWQRFESCVVVAEESLDARIDRREWSRLREERIRECLVTSR